MCFFFLFVWGCFLLFIYINKNETRCRATTMPLLTTLWVNQLVLFQHHVTADHRAPISLAGAVTWPGHGQSSGCTSPLVPQHAVLNLLLLQPLTKRQRPTSHSRPISVLCFQKSTLHQPAACSLPIKAGIKPQPAPHLPASLSPCSIWPVSFSQFYPPGRQSASLSSFLACWNPKILVSFPASFSTLQITVLTVKTQLVEEVILFFSLIHSFILFTTFVVLCCCFSKMGVVQYQTSGTCFMFSGVWYTHVFRAVSRVMNHTIKHSHSPMAVKSLESLGFLAGCFWQIWLCRPQFVMVPR